MLPYAASRLKQIRRIRGLSQQSFAHQLGVAVRSYRAYELGERALSEVAIASLASLGINIDWLLNGKGEMDSPAIEQYQRMGALVRYWEASSQLLSANMESARSLVTAKFGEEAAAAIFDTLEQVKVSKRDKPYGKKS